MLMHASTLKEVSHLWSSIDGLRKALERRFAEQAITVPGPETQCIAAACRAHHMTVAIGVTERPARAGTLYNTLLYFGPDGMILGRHRKLMP